ncbi:NAD(P)H-dependent oxidoreductase subunit E [Dethiothermospora halolimnae]|uniref:NADH-quinone oxidoreductase subunit NuoE family protein n=1 Tax=Dethiothermospora halolimnae TaxID=3114390 RepID=UPI003CCB8A4A
MDYKERVLTIIEEVGTTGDKLIEILLKVQNTKDKKYITEEELKIVSRELKVPLSKVYGVVTFYSMFSLKKRGRYVIEICNSGPCYVNGSRNIVKIFENILGIKIGETTKDGLFSMDYTSCIGACDVAPAVKINDQVYGNLNEEKIKAIIADLRKGEE